MRIGLTSLAFDGKSMPSGIDYVEDVPTKRTSSADDMLGFLHGVDADQFGTSKFENVCRRELEKWSERGYNSFIYGSPTTRQVRVQSKLGMIQSICRLLPRTIHHKHFLIELLDCQALRDYKTVRQVADAVSMIPNNWSVGVVLDLGEAVRSGMTTSDIINMPRIERFHLRGVDAEEPFDVKQMAGQVSLLDRWLDYYDPTVVDLTFESRAADSHYREFIDFADRRWRA